MADQTHAEVRSAPDAESTRDETLRGGEARTFGDLLRRHRTSAELTQEELAERAGLSTRAISDLERGLHRAPSQWTLKCLNEALSLSPDEYLQFQAAGSRRRGPPTPSRVIASRLPAPSTPLIGREEEHDRVVHLLRGEGVRLLTLVGTGGIGKSRLAIQVAASVAPDFTDGVVFVPLAALNDDRLVLQSVASALGVRPGVKCSMADSIASHLEDRVVLVVIDNFEHVSEAAPCLSEILGRCPNVRLLVTSRSSLRLRGEYEVEVGPLAIPSELPVRGLGNVHRYPAVELFVQRAQAVRGDFALNEKNLSVVVEICRRVDGLPLALELAAARLKTVSPGELLARLEDRLHFLTGGARDLPKRQQTMRSTVDWSYQLLKPGEQALFRSLSIFVGGFDIPAVMEVGEGTWRTSTDALGSLTSLVDQSLLKRAEQKDGQPRFSMLETIREYGLERLSEAGELPGVARLHAHYFRAMAERAETELTGPEQQPWLDRLETEHGNLRTALRWFHDGDLPELMLGMALSLHYFWFTRGHTDEGRSWLGQGLIDPSRINTRLEAKALRSAGFLAWVGGDSEAVSLLEQALQLSRSLKDQADIAWSLLTLGNATGPVERKTALMQEALDLFRRVDNTRGIAWALANLGMSATSQGDYQWAIQCLEEAVLLFQDVSGRTDVASAQTSLAWAVLGNGGYDRASRIFRDTLEVYEELGDRRGKGSSLYALGWLALESDAFEQAKDLMRQALILWEEAAMGFTPHCVHGLACVAASTDQMQRAATLFGAAASLFETLGATLSAFESTHQKRLVAAVRRQMGDSAWVTAWESGQAWKARKAIACALADEDPYIPVSGFAAPA